MKNKFQHNEAVSSVVGEMIMVALVIILVALFATSAFSLIPGGREPSVEIVMKNEAGSNPVAGDTVVIFWHKGGDWVEKTDLSVVVIGADGNRQSYKPEYLYDYAGKKTGTFDLGGNMSANLGKSLKSKDTVRVLTPMNVLYSGEVV